MALSRIKWALACHRNERPGKIHRFTLMLRVTVVQSIKDTTKFVRVVAGKG
jgi:hypothetical protein